MRSIYYARLYFVDLLTLLVVSKTFAGCLNNEYQCKNKCIELVKRCDKHPDCDEGEDENDCSEYLITLTKIRLW